MTRHPISSASSEAEPEAASDQHVQRAPHDELFKAIFRSKDEAVSLLRSALPQEVTARIHWPSLRNEPTEQVDARLAKRYNDLLFRVNLIGQQREAFIEVALEHQSSSERMMALRMLGLIVRRTELLLKASPTLERLPIVVPVVLFQGEGKRATPWRHPVRYSQLLDADELTVDAFRRFIPDFEFVLDDLTQQSRDTLHARQLTAAAWVTLTLLREATSNPQLLQQLRNPADLAQWRNASEGPNAAMVLERIWVYLYRVVDIPTEDLHDFAKVVSELAEKTQMSTAQRMIDEVAPRLRAEGRVEGRVEGKAGTLTRLVQLKFGEVDPTVLARIASGSAEELDLWTERILFAQSLEELFRA